MSPAESLLARREQPTQNQGKEGKRKPTPTDPLPKSQVLGKVKDFLGEIAKANEKLQQDTQDLLLGIADLHSEQAVEVAEATMNGLQPSGNPFTCSSSDSEDDSDGDDGDQLNVCDKDRCTGPNEVETNPTKGKKPRRGRRLLFWTRRIYEKSLVRSRVYLFGVVLFQKPSARRMYEKA